MKITNTQAGPRGVNAISGAVLIEPGQTIETEVYAREKALIEASGWFEVKGDYTADPGAPVAAPMNDTGDSAKLKSALDAKETEIADLKQTIKAHDGEIAELKAKIAEQSKPALKGPFEAREKSPGWFAIHDADGKVIGKSFREDDAKAFNALDDAGKLKAAEEAAA